MKNFALIVLASTSALALSSQLALADYTLNLLHINDWHSRIESINRYESTCSAEDETEGKCFGGAARLVTAVAEARKRHQGANVLFLNAGDNFQGSLFYTTYKGAVEAEFLNLMKTDAMAVGNHEFDDGEPGLATFLDVAQFPVLSANVLASYKSALGDRVKPSVVLEVGGEKIGIVGAVANDTEQLASPGPEVLIVEDVAAITSAVEQLKTDGVNKIIALTHVGYPRDLEKIAKIPGVDVVVGGHSHTLLANNDDKAAGPYPTWVDNPEGYRVPVVQAASYSMYLGDLAVTFDDNGVVTDAKGDPVLLDSSVAPDEAVLARVKELAAPIEELKAQKVAETSKEIDGSRDNCRARECEMGNLVADAILDRVKDQGIQIAIQNGGGLRASIDAGEITMGEVLTVLPFQNTLATFQLTGADIVQSLEAGVSEVEEGKGRFPQVSGLRYSFDPGKAPNEGRVSDVMVRQGETWEPIDPGKLYGVVTNNFVRGGGDGYELFAEKAQNAYDYGPGLELVVAEYLAANQPYQPYLDGRITEIAGSADEPEQPAAATTQPATSEPAVTPAQPASSEPAVTTPELPETSATLMTTPPQIEPAMEKTEAETTGETGQTTHTVEPGDTLWKLARRYYGDARMWKKIAEANPDVRTGGLKVGSTLTVPPAN